MSGSLRDGIIDGRILVLGLTRLKSLELELLLSNHLQETIDMCFLFSLKLLMEFTQTWCPMMMGICQQGGAG